jgi:hypothetical protein
MERLTARTRDNVVYMTKCAKNCPVHGNHDCASDCSNMWYIIEKLAEYEDLEDELDKKFSRCLTVKGIVNSVIEFCDQKEKDEELAECLLITNDDVRKYKRWKEAEEQGLLLRLPCKVGDILYVIDTDEKIDNLGIMPYTIDNIVILNTREVLFKYDNYDGVICYLENIITDKPYLDYYRVFLTKSEAEQELAKMKEQYDEKQSLIDFFETDDYKKKNWSMHMDITMDRDMSQEHAEKVIFSALRSAGMKGHKGGIS